MMTLLLFFAVFMTIFVTAPTGAGKPVPALSWAMVSIAMLVLLTLRLLATGAVRLP